jgi:hypothetical protein
VCFSLFWATQSKSPIEWQFDSGRWKTLSGERRQRLAGQIPLYSSAKVRSDRSPDNPASSG